jgi:hypothetical protein
VAACTHPHAAGVVACTGYLAEARTVEAAYVTLLEGARAERLHRVSSLGDAKSSLGDAKSSLGDA